MLHGGILTTYARKSAPPELRVARFIEGERRLTWTRLFLDAFPHADIFLVGGTLRDVLLGRFPNDIDLVIRNIPLEELEHWLTRNGAADIVGRFGTIKFVPHGSQSREPIDIALPRTEHMTTHHAHGRNDMEIRFDHKLNIEEDLARRDFTVNAIAYNFETGRLIDPFLGLEDLHHGIISAVLVPEQRFLEDATRMLRALRLSSQLGFGIEQLTWQAIQANIKLLNTTRLNNDGEHEYAIPRELIGREFLLGFIRHPMHTLELWNSSGALGLFMPELKQLEDILHDDNEDLYRKTASLLDLLTNASFLTQHNQSTPSATLLVAALMSMVKDMQHVVAYRICSSLYFHQFTKNHLAYVDCKEVMWLLEHINDFENNDPASLAPSQFERSFLSPQGQRLLTLMHARFLIQGKHTVARDRLHTAMKIVRDMEHLATSNGFEKLPRLISGTDIKQFGVSEGPIYRDYMDAIRDAQWLQEIHTREEALHRLQTLIAQKA